MLWPAIERSAIERSPVWDLFREFEGWHNRLSRWMAEGDGRVWERPALNLWSGENDAVVTAELPGVEAKDLEVSVVGDTLTIRAGVAAPELKEGETWHRRERAYGQCVRTLRLPFQVDAAKVDARLVRGVLQVTLPRAAEDQPRKISVKSA